MTARQLAALTLVAMPLCAVAPAQDDAVLADLLAQTGDATTADRSSYTLTVQHMTMGAVGDHMVDAMVDLWESLTRNGERVVGDAECWVLESGAVAGFVQQR
jgi:hypothetical protein